VSIDVQNTATHEEGHSIGLAHSLDPLATMYATAPAGETSKRILSDDDIAAVCTIYPKGAQTATCLGDPIALAVNGESDNVGCGCTTAGSASPSIEGGFAAIALWSLYRSRTRRRAL
jgi:MYXO-CTERM domain-containing protein